LNYSAIAHHQPVVISSRRFLALPDQQWIHEPVAEQKLTKNFFGILSYTLYRSEFSEPDGLLAPASWDNRRLVSLTMRYKIN
jgi:hypothetical protein